MEPANVKEGDKDISKSDLGRFGEREVGLGERSLPS